MSQLYEIFTPEIEILEQTHTNYKALFRDQVGRDHYIEGEYTIELDEDRLGSKELHIRHLTAFNTKTDHEYKDRVLSLIAAELSDSSYTQELLDQLELMKGEI